MASSEKYIPIFRHGQFDGPGRRGPDFGVFADSLSDKSKEYPLTPEGESQILASFRQVPDYIKTDLILVSEFLRTQQSANVMAEEVKNGTGRQVKVVVSPLLNSIWMPPDSLSRKEYESLIQTDQKNAVADRMFNIWAEGKIGETPKLIKRRIENFLAFLETQVDLSSSVQPVVVTHASFSSAMQRHIQGIILTSPRDEGQILNVAGYYVLGINNEQEKRKVDVITFWEKYIGQASIRISLDNL